MFWNVFQQNKGSFLNWIWLFHFELAKSQLKFDYSISDLTISFWTCYIPIQICLFYFEFAIFQLRFDYSILNLLCSNSGLTIPFQICLFHLEFAYFIFGLLSPNSNLISPKLNLQWYIIMQTYYKLLHLGGVPLATNHSDVPDQWATAHYFLFLGIGMVWGVVSDSVSPVFTVFYQKLEININSTLLRNAWPT